MIVRLYRLLAFFLLVVFAQSSAWAQFPMATPREGPKPVPGDGQWVDFPTISFPVGVDFNVHIEGAVETSTKHDSVDAHFAFGPTYGGTQLPPDPTFNNVGMKMKSSVSIPEAYPPAFQFKPSFYAASHKYDLTVNGRGAGDYLSFRIFDRKDPSVDPTYYGDNIGALTVTVAQKTPMLAKDVVSIDLGIVTTTQTKTGTINIQSYGTDPQQITSIKVVPADPAIVLTAERGVGAFTLNEGEKNWINVDFTPKVIGDLGNKRWDLIITTANGFDKTISIPITAFGQGPFFSTFPDPLDFGFQRVGSSLQLTAAVSNAGNVDVTAVSASVNPSGGPFRIGANFPNIIDPSKNVAKANHQQNVDVPVSYLAPASGNQSAVVSVLWSDGSFSTFTVIAQSGYGNAALSETTPIDIGTTYLNVPIQRTLQVSNTGKVPIFFQLAVPPNPNPNPKNDNPAEFSIVKHPPASINPTDKPQDVTVQFSPQSYTPNGIHRAKLTYTFDINPIEIDLVGHDHHPFHASFKIDTSIYESPGREFPVVQHMFGRFDSALQPIRKIDEHILYDSKVITFVSAEKGRDLSSPDWTISTPSVTPGDIHVLLQSSNAGAVEGDILKLTFRVNDNAKEGDTSLLTQTGFDFGVPEPLVSSADAGLFHVYGICSPPHVVGDGHKFGTFIEQNSPNPFNPLTKIRYTLNDAAHVRIRTYNMMGALVATPVDEDRSAGEYSVTFDASALPAGVYTYSFDAGDYHRTRTMVLAK